MPFARWTWNNARRNSIYEGGGVILGLDSHLPPTVQMHFLPQLGILGEGEGDMEPHPFLHQLGIQCLCCTKEVVLLPRMMWAGLGIVTAEADRLPAGLTCSQHLLEEMTTRSHDIIIFSSDPALYSSEREICRWNNILHHH